MKPNFLVSLFLIVCMVYSTTAAAFLHMNEHHHMESHVAEHQHDADHSHQHDEDNDADHAHHFNLHVIGDLVEHDTLSFSQTNGSLSDEFFSRLISRNYSPSIPPPNA